MGSKRVYPAVLAALCACAALAGCGEDAPATPEQQPPPADPAIEAFVEDTWPAGVGGAVAVTDGDGVVHCRGAGTGGSCDTVYDIGSLTKGFTGAAVAALAMDGELSVEDRIGEYIDGVPPDKRAITIEDLLTHTSGLTPSLGDDYEPLGRDEMLERAMGSKLRSAPGEKHLYSNVGYSVLAAIVEEASGTGYEEYLAERLFERAGMNQTGYVLPDWDETRIATELDAEGRDRGTPLEHPWAADGPYWNLRGNGGLLSTPADMARWALALDGTEVLDAEAKEELFEPRVLEEPGGDSRYAYGWVISPTPLGRLAWHDGSNDLSYAVIGRFAEPRVTVFAISSDAYRADGESLPDRAQELVLGAAGRASGSG